MMNASLRTATGLVAMALLASCQSVKPSEPSPPPAPAYSAADMQLPEVKPPPQPPKVKPPQVASVQPHPPKEETNKSEDREMPDIGAVGIEEVQLKTMLGDPAGETDNDPQKVLKFHWGKCEADFSLYPDVEARVYRTLSYEVANDDGTAKGRRLCIADLRTRIQSR